MGEKNSSKGNQSEDLKRLKQERRDITMNQAIVSEVGAMDYGPRYQDSADELAQDLTERNKKIKEKMDDILDDLEEGKL